MSKGAGTTRTISRSGLPEFQLPYLMHGLAEARRFYEEGPPQFFPGSTVAGFRPAEVLAHQYLQEQAGPMAQLVEGAVPHLRAIMGAYDVAENPYIRAAAEAATRPVMQALREQALPAIRTGAVGTGTYGGSRQALAEAQAIERAARAMGDVTAGMYGQAYTTGLGAALNAIGAIPGVQRALAYPGEVLGSVGAQERALEQARVAEEMARHEHGQLAPRLALQEYMRLVGVPMGGETTTEAQASAPGGATQWAGFFISLLPYLGRLFRWF